tara:strand:+ start:429 stop:638 length:210 start_codon:yes stop_codon:yes gene_type:complete
LALLLICIGYQEIQKSNFVTVLQTLFDNFFFRAILLELKKAIPKMFASWGRALVSLSLRNKNNKWDGFL